MKRLLLALSIVALAGFGCAQAVSPPDPSVSFGSTVMLSVGKSLTFEDGLTTTLTQIDDSRCKQGVACIWQGELSPHIELTGGEMETSATAVLGTERGPSTSAGPYTVSLIGATETTATFVVTVAK